jgi:G3E family GTPase
MIEKIPIYLLTGFLGSGKTTLLKRWLQEPLLQHSALIVNEIGAVGLDHATLGYASDTSALLADSCVCCTGLPGLHEALENLFWARLHRGVARFDSVVIETTGLADPAPLVTSLKTHRFVSERFCLAGIVTTLGAPTALAIMTEFAEARSQLDAAGVVVVTKTDLAADAQLDAVSQALRRSNPATHILLSTQGSLSADEVWHAARSAIDSSQRSPKDRSWHVVKARVTAAGLVRRAIAPHNADTRFETIVDEVSADSLRNSLAGMIARHRTRLLRMKGIVQLACGTSVVVQFTRGDEKVQISPAPETMQTALTGMPSGVTLILRSR